jgi:hypothetical protein
MQTLLHSPDLPTGIVSTLGGRRIHAPDPSFFASYLILYPLCLSEPWNGYDALQYRSSPAPVTCTDCRKYL